LIDHSVTTITSFIVVDLVTQCLVQHFTLQGLGARINMNEQLLSSTLRPLLSLNLLCLAKLTDGFPF